MIQRYPSIHELLKQEHHHQAPKLLLLPISANKSGNCVLKENAFNVKIQYLTSGPMEQESGRPLFKNSTRGLFTDDTEINSISLTFIH